MILKEFYVPTERYHHDIIPISIFLVKILDPIHGAWKTLTNRGWSLYEQNLPNSPYTRDLCALLSPYHNRFDSNGLSIRHILNFDIQDKRA